MVGALMSSAPAAVLSCVNQTAQHGQVHVRFRHHSRVLEGRAAPGCATPIRFPCARAVAVPQRRPAAYSVQSQTNPASSASFRNFAQRRTRKPGLIADAKLGAVTPDRRGIITGGPPALWAQSKRAFASDPEFTCGKRDGSLVRHALSIKDRGADGTECRTLRLRQAASAISSRTVSPAWLARLMSVSRLKFVIRPRSRSLSRGCVIPSRRAASACVTCQLRTR